jgi:hypothetical protein
MGPKSVAAAAIVLIVLPFGSLEKEHVDAFRRWTDLREEVDNLEYDLGIGEPSNEIVERLRELDAKKQRESVALKLWPTLIGQRHVRFAGRV